MVVWTPYGRQITVSILVEYLRRDHERGLVDEYWIYLNTDPEQILDLRYAYELAQQYPDWIRLVERPPDCPRRSPKQRNTGYAYRYMTDPDTVFVRLDDDIIYVHEDCVERLAVAKLEMRPTLCAHALMWNNAITSWFLQQSGVIPQPGEVTGGYTWPTVGGPYCMDPVGWADGEFAVALHRLLLERVECEIPSSLFLYQDMPLQLGQQFSVSAFASLGEDYAALPQPGVLEPDEEEHWHTVHQPRQIGSPNIIIGNALVSHYTFAPQRRVVLETDVLDRYRALAAKLTA